MREIADAGRIRHFMRVFGAAAQVPTRVYFTGGATAVLLGWRASTIDVDIRVEPDTDALFRAIPDIKETLQLNVELKSPADFIPAPPGWQDRSPFIAQEGHVSFHHFEPYAQALAKVERSHRQDLEDVRLICFAILPSIRDHFGGRSKKFSVRNPSGFHRAVRYNQRRSR